MGWVLILWKLFCRLRGKDCRNCKSALRHAMGTNSDLVKDGDKTTYVVNCPPSDTTCIAFDSDNAMTVIAGSNSKYPDHFGESTY